MSAGKSWLYDYSEFDDEMFWAVEEDFPVDTEVADQ